MRCWAGYELLMHRLFLAFYPFDMLPENEANRFYETYLALQNGTNPLYAYMALRYFEVGLQFFLRQGYKIVFMFDEFEEMLKQLPVKFFQTLRGIRDANKRQSGLHDLHPLAAADAGRALRNSRAGHRAVHRAVHR